MQLHYSVTIYTFEFIAGPAQDLSRRLFPPPFSLPCLSYLVFVPSFFIFFFFSYRGSHPPSFSPILELPLASIYVVIYLLYINLETMAGVLGKSYGITPCARTNERTNQLTERCSSRLVSIL